MSRSNNGNGAAPATNLTDAINAAELDRRAAQILTTISGCCGSAPLCAACHESQRRAAGYMARAEYLRNPDEPVTLRVPAAEYPECTECGVRDGVRWDGVERAWLCDRCGAWLDARRGQA